MKDKDCSWDSSKHPEQPECPHHGGGKGKYKFRIYVPVKDSDGHHGTTDKEPQGKSVEIDAESYEEAKQKVLEQNPGASITKVTHPDGTEEDLTDVGKKYANPEYQEPDVKTPENREKITKFMQILFNFKDKEHAFDDEWWNSLSKARIKEILEMIKK